MEKSLYLADQKLITEGRFFRLKECNRAVFLRGVNLSGSVKQPFTPYLPSHESRGFYETKNTSFVGRPFPLNEADEHFQRLKQWGFNFCRFNITWEAIEHAGPGIYDHDYIQYVIAVLKKAKEYGFKVFIDPHQDVWSRFTGGSGAPKWTLELAGFKPENFTESRAAILQSTYPDPEEYPKMIWPTNYFKLAAFTMFTLFFGGKVFAPRCKVGNVNIQDYLQSHYMNAVCALARAIKAEPGLEDYVVIGYDTLNEPSSGLIGMEDISRIAKEQELRKGYTPTPFQAMLMGEAIDVFGVEVWDMTVVGPSKIGVENLKSSGVRAWKDGAECIWATHGVWDVAKRRLLDPHYFSKYPTTGEVVDFMADFWKPFVNDFAKAIRSVHSEAIIFIEPPVNALPPPWEEGDTNHRICYAPHWYDGITLINKHFNSWYTVDYIGFLRGKYPSVAFAVKFGESGIKNCFKSQLNTLRTEGETYIGDIPTLLGEIGIPYDMDNKYSYRTGDYSCQVSAMDANASALERELLNFTYWNYCSDNSHKWGDQWNGEDLSIWSRPEDQDPGIFPVDLDRGGRALEGFVRPYPIVTAGTPRYLNFDLKRKIFKFMYTVDSRFDIGSTETVFYIPRLQYPDGINVITSCGTFSYYPELQQLIWQCGCEKNSLSVDSDSTYQNRDLSIDGDRMFDREGRLLHKIVIRDKNSPDDTRSVHDVTFDQENLDGVCPKCTVM